MMTITLTSGEYIHDVSTVWMEGDLLAWDNGEEQGYVSLEELVCVDCLCGLGEGRVEALSE
jgi:hypothetical protein